MLPSPQFTRQIGLLWNHLPWVKKMLDGWPNIGILSSVCPRQLFFLQICLFPVNSESFWVISISKNILFINFRDLRRHGGWWRAIDIDYPLRTEVKNLIFFRPIFMIFDLFYGWKAPKLGKLGIWLLKLFAAGKKANLLWFGAPKFWQHW